MARVATRDLCKAYTRPNGTGSGTLPVLESITLQVQEGEFVTIIGPNGCGKSTLLRVIGGLEEPDRGTVTIAGRQPGRVSTGFIFQNYGESLYPWNTVLDNVAFPLRLAGIGREEQRSRVSELMAQLELNIPLDRYPYQLSGGQQQMVAIARALILKPDILIMDEPFGALDCEMRLELQDNLLAIWQRRPTTTLFVSHEIEEAIYLADRVVILSRRPASIAAEVPVALSRPRKRAQVHTSAFVQLRADVESQFNQARGKYCAD